MPALHWWSCATLFNPPFSFSQYESIRQCRGWTKETHYAADATIIVELTKILSFNGNLSVWTDHLPQEVKISMMMSDAAMKDDLCARQALMELGDMPN